MGRNTLTGASLTRGCPLFYVHAPAQNRRFIGGQSKSEYFADTMPVLAIRHPPDDVSNLRVYAEITPSQLPCKWCNGRSEKQRITMSGRHSLAQRRQRVSLPSSCASSASCSAGRVCISMRPDKDFAARFKRIRLLRLACSKTTMHICIGEQIRTTIGTQVRPQARNRNDRFPVDGQQARLCSAVPLEDRNEDRRIRYDKRITVGIIGPRPGSAYQEGCSNMVDASQAPTIERVMPSPERRLPLRFCKQHLFKKNQWT